MCQKVASASNSFLWTGEFSGFYGGMTVSQKLPIRSYVGFERTFDKAIHVNREYDTYDAEKQQFITASLDIRLTDNLTRYLERYCADQAEFTGLKVHILTEVPLGHSLGSNGAIASALALLLDNSTEEKTLSIARDILSMSQAGHSSGVTAYMALTQHQSPVVFFNKKDGYFAKSIEELASLQSTPIWPIDFGLIYTGVQTNAEGVILANDQMVNELEIDTQKLNALLGSTQKLNFRQTYIDMLNMTASLTIMSLVDLFTKGTQNELLEQLFNSLNEFQNLLHILHISNGTTDLVYSRIHQLANRQTNDVGSGVKISGIGKGGAVLFAIPYGTHREALVDLIEELRSETQRPVSLDYASWLDGIGGQPGKIEQDIASDISSSFIDRDALSVTLLKHGKAHAQTLTSERFDQMLPEIDIVLDQTSGKIKVGGQSVTSKQIMSQKATVSILAELVRSARFTLKNTHLPASYGTSRYDLQGKITTPLIKTVKELTGRDLLLTISGGMYDNYELSLDPSNIVIALIQKKR